jgi:hypothetical protein
MEYSEIENATRVDIQKETAGCTVGIKACKWPMQITNHLHALADFDSYYFDFTPQFT